MENTKKNLTRILTTVLSVPFLFPACAHTPSREIRVENWASHPFEKGVSFKVSQGAFGKTSHQEPGNEYNWDLDVPYKTKVLAIHSGKVLEVWMPPGGGGCDAKFKDAAHNIKIEHGDGTVAQYVHVEPLVKVGQVIRQGDSIARTAMNGWICQPHLHLGLYRSKNHLYSSKHRQTLPLAFWGLGVLEEGKFYASQGRIQGYEIDTELVREFQKKACSTQTPRAFERAWLAHENQFPVYEKLYYQDARDKKERRGLAKDFRIKKQEVCTAVEQFLNTAAPEIHQSALEMEKLLGSLPSSRILFTVPMKLTDGKTSQWEGSPLIALNASHATFQRERGLRATVFHELYHDAQGKLFEKDMALLSPLEKSLYREGAATYAVETQFPDIGRKALGLNDQKLQLADEHFPSVLQKMIQVLEGKVTHPDFERDWFTGGETCSPYPCKMGYVIGNKVFHEIGASLGRESAIRLPPAEFKRQLRMILSGLHAGSVK